MSHRHKSGRARQICLGVALCFYSLHPCCRHLPTSHQALKYLYDAHQPVLISSAGRSYAVLSLEERASLEDLVPLLGIKQKAQPRPRLRRCPVTSPTKPLAF
ncbi:hypothetical protein HRR83_003770 [Exophiala dermatitidis]|uniref:Uncharacterized protein n=1 Tax=Exophiala dermatitidis TaxID=5970 RepID=A0AAN6EXN5_EXODE|nr:hypothetical protein HRR74_002848 [Exophiala dermatitidis]KAJ4529590.1 hypothetical protein HRR73_000616 [Exophiala dermatitidis]KAJ4543248.1 hypothetical protein HRR77_005503 [Exophiala dermatitidis]KAJ4543748.1 hypothetical protein HRR76_001811 [Exophiala dermatitidis]KAJ4575212.1 hypothetical protein HRR79_002141 [Exophiala dermatitidis]